MGSGSVKPAIDACKEAWHGGWATWPLSFTASDLNTFEDCEARFYHSQQHYRDGLLATDNTAVGLSTAAHAALMAFHLRADQVYQCGRPITPDSAPAQLRSLMTKQLFRARLDASRPDVAVRLAKLMAGLDQIAPSIVAELPSWISDPARNESLVWVEAALDHGSNRLAVELTDGYEIRTRPDLIGIRRNDADLPRAIVRDYKAKGDIVDPAFDSGIIIRALWVLAEIRRPRCAWFLKGRTIPVDSTAIEVETVNLLHAGSPEFVLSAVLTGEELLQCRDQFAQIIDAMAVSLRIEEAEAVSASPGPFCLFWCPYLAKCPSGMAYVRKYKGDEVLDARLTPRRSGGPHAAPNVSSSSESIR